MAKKVVRVRMYRVGFGDCFLITFPGPRHVLIDCGSLGRDSSVELRPVIENVLAETDRHVHVVVLSHRHADHARGFGVNAGLWETLRVDEVWMPWTEDQKDEVATLLRRRHDEIAHDLLGKASGFTAELVRNCIGDETARDVLLHGFAGNPVHRFLAGQAGELPCDALPRVHVEVVGPRRSDDLLKRMGLECSLVELTAAGNARQSGPFAKQWELQQRHAESLFGGRLRRRKPLDDARSETTDQLCYWLDKTINNTSLVLFLRYGKARLLFPGDAQGEAWMPFLLDAELGSRLRQLDFYKVAHHGSHNGTPRRAMNAMGKMRSFVSTAAAEAWPEVPRPGLLRDLKKHGPVIRSDAPTRARGVVAAERWVDIDLPA